LTMQESGFVHFLRTFPLWMITLPVYLIHGAVYVWVTYGIGAIDQFVKEMTKEAWGALVLSIGIRLGQTVLNPNPTQQENKAEGNMTVINPQVDNPPVSNTDLQNITPTEIESAVEGLEVKEN